MIDGECLHCGSDTGYEVKTVERLLTWYGWDNEAINTTMDYISGGVQKRCMDCRKVIKEQEDEGD